MVRAGKAEIMDYMAWRAAGGLKPRSAARQLSSFRRFYRYLLREDMIEGGSHQSGRDAKNRSVIATVPY